LDKNSGDTFGFTKKSLQREAYLSTKRAIVKNNPFQPQSAVNATAMFPNIVNNNNSIVELGN
jgi:hypothetical protein